VRRWPDELKLAILLLKLIAVLSQIQKSGIGRELSEYFLEVPWKKQKEKQRKTGIVFVITK
jgi:hypothetical protein